MKIIKTKFQAKTRRFSANWTIEETQEIDNELAKILQEEIDKEFLRQIQAEQLVNEGWTKIPFIVKTSIEWFKENIQDEYEMINGAMYFKSHDDAVLYSLTWSK